MLLTDSALNRAIKYRSDCAIAMAASMHVACAICRARPVSERRGVDHALLFGPTQGVALVRERLCGSHLSIHEDDDGDVLRVRYQARLHDVLAALQGPEDARAVIDFERGH